MAVKTRIVGIPTDGIEREVKVSEEGGMAVYIMNPPIQPIGTPNRMRFYRQIVTGLNVDGSVTPQYFYVTSDNTSMYDLYIEEITIILAGTNITNAKYGNLSALTNGTDIYLEQGTDKEYIIQAAKTNGQITLQSGATNIFGNTTNTNVLSNYSSNTDAYVVSLKLTDYIPGGLRLGAGTPDRIVIKINDNLSTMADHYIQFLGYKLYE